MGKVIKLVATTKVAHETNPSTPTFNPWGEENSDRLTRIRESLIKINNLIQSLREQSEVENGQGI